MVGQAPILCNPSGIRVLLAMPGRPRECHLELGILGAWTRKLLSKSPPFREPVSMSVDTHGMKIGYLGFPDEGSRRLPSPGQAEPASLPRVHDRLPPTDSDVGRG